MPKRDDLKKFIQIKNQTSDSADLYFYGDIVSSWWGAWDDTDQYPESVRDFLKNEEGKNLNIYINSGGGSVFAGMAIYNMLKRHQGSKTVYVDGLAGSIASVIALAGDKVIIPSNAFMMIHKPWMYTYGNSNELREQAAMLETIEEGILNVYKENLRDGIDIEEIKQMINDETWLNGEEAEKYFNVEVCKPVEAVACTSEYFDKYEKIPSKFKNRIENRFKKDEFKNKKDRLLMELELI